MYAAPYAVVPSAHKPRSSFNYQGGLNYGGRFVSQRHQQPLPYLVPAQPRIHVQSAPHQIYAPVIPQRYAAGSSPSFSYVQKPYYAPAPAMALPTKQDYYNPTARQVSPPLAKSPSSRAAIYQQTTLLTREQDMTLATIKNQLSEYIKHPDQYSFLDKRTLLESITPEALEKQFGVPIKNPELNQDIEKLETLYKTYLEKEQEFIRLCFKSGVHPHLDGDTAEELLENMHKYKVSYNRKHHIIPENNSVHLMFFDRTDSQYKIKHINHFNPENIQTYSFKGISELENGLKRDELKYLQASENILPTEFIGFKDVHKQVPVSLLPHTKSVFFDHEAQTLFVLIVKDDVEHPEKMTLEDYWSREPLVLTPPETVIAAARFFDPTFRSHLEMAPSTRAASVDTSRSDVKGYVDMPAYRQLDPALSYRQLPAYSRADVPPPPPPPLQQVEEYKPPHVYTSPRAWHFESRPSVQPTHSVQVTPRRDFEPTPMPGSYTARVPSWSERRFERSGVGSVAPTDRLTLAELNRKIQELDSQMTYSSNERYTNSYGEVPPPPPPPTSRDIFSRGTSQFFPTPDQLSLRSTVDRSLSRFHQPNLLGAVNNGWTHYAR